MHQLRLAPWPGLAVLVCVGMACNTDPGVGASGAGLVTVITAATRDSSGYALTIRLTNADTGAIGYAPYCPGRVMVWHGGRPLTAPDAGSICRAVEREIEPGQSTSFSLPGQPLVAGDQVRYVTTWMWLNGNSGSSSVSAAVPVQ